MSLDHLSTLVDFIKENKKLIIIPHLPFFTEDDTIDLFCNSAEVVSQIVSLACQINKRIHSENISIAIEEVSSRWEVTM